MSHDWNHNLALIWTKMVAPSRPSISELNIYSKYARILQNSKREKLKLLVLGSTPEFRDWGYEYNFDITVIDNNKDYYETIFREIRHKDIKETLINEKWQNLNAIQEYDIIIGDLAIGNIPPVDLENFIEKVSKALTKNGLFLGKSFYTLKNYVPVEFRKMVIDYYNGPPYNPYSYFAYNLTIGCLDENNLLCFKKQYDVVKKLNEAGILKDETFEYFTNVGWDTQMKFLFHVPNVEVFESLVQKYLSIHKIEYGQEIYSNNFPLHIITTKNTNLFIKE